MERSRHSLCGDREASIVVESCHFSFLSFASCDSIYILTTIHYSNGQRPTLCCSQIEMVPSKHMHQNKNQNWSKIQRGPNSCRYAQGTPDQVEHMFKLKADTDFGQFFRLLGVRWEPHLCQQPSHSFLSIALA